jgi:hypothetical protein
VVTEEYMRKEISDFLYDGGDDAPVEEPPKEAKGEETKNSLDAPPHFDEIESKFIF